MAKILKEEIEKLKLNEIKGEVIGLSLKDDLQFVLEKEGPEALKKVEDEMERWGCPLKLKEIKDFSWYPERFNLVLFVVRKILDWPVEKMREMGAYTAKISFIARIMMRYFISLERVLKAASGYWRKYHTTGTLEVEKFNEKERVLILALRDFTAVSPEHCRYLEGYIWQIGSYVLPTENLKVEEVECSFFGGKDHKFKVTW